MSGRPPALDYLYSLERFGIKFGLENIRTIVETLGRPDRAFHSVHIAGTNGKGSVTAMVDAALRAAGHRSARFTSPHLIDLTERFVIDGHPVTEPALVAVIGDVRDCIAGLIAAGAIPAQPTFFEVTTAAALELFRRAGVEVGVIEVGLGGRLDSTNVITPRVTAITSIAFDHEQYLGHTLTAIAAEKAGIIKPRVPVVVGRVTEEARVAIEDIARERGAPIVPAWEGVSARRVQPTPGQPTRIHLRTPARDYGEVMLSLRGDHQIGNAVVAVRILEQLARRRDRRAGGRDCRRPGARVVARTTGAPAPPRWTRDDPRRCPQSGRRRDARRVSRRDVRREAAAGVRGDDRQRRPRHVRGAAAGRLGAGRDPIVDRAVGRSGDARADRPSRSRRIFRCASNRFEPTPWPPPGRVSPRIVVAGSIFLLGDVLNEAALS